jgi:hypothetical protein
MKEAGKGEQRQRTSVVGQCMWQNMFWNEAEHRDFDGVF